MGAGTVPSEVAATFTPHRATIPVVLTGVFMATLDFFVVNVAVPSMQRDLHASDAQVQWLVAGYGLAYGAGLITGGRLGDLYGRRRIFSLGLALFTLTSAACGLAPGAGFLVLARVLQGASAALLAPQVLAILGTAYTGPARAQAFNLYGFTMGVAAVIGQLLGGLLIEANPWGLGWRACFLINVPVGVAAVLLARRVVAESRAAGRPRLDAWGVVLVTLGLTALALPLIDGRQAGWPAWSWTSPGAAGALLLGFALHQRHRSTTDAAPLIEPALFRERAFTVGLLAQLAFFMSQASYFLVLALYLQEGRGASPLQAGGVFVALGAGYLATSILAGRVARRLGRQVIALGALGRASGMAVLLVTIWATPDLAVLTPALAVVGAGSGLIVGPLAGTVLARVPSHHAGAASGVLTTALQIGNALGVAIVGAVFYGTAGAAQGPGAYRTAFAASLLSLIAGGVLLAVLVQLLPRRRA